MKLLTSFAFLALSTVITGLCLGIGTASLAAAEPVPSSLLNFKLKHGIEIKIPKGWRIIESKRTLEMNANAGKSTGVNQGDNEILLAANLDDPKSGAAVATVRVSIRHKETLSQAAVEAMPQATLDEQGRSGCQMALTALEKSGSPVRVSPYRMTKDRISGLLAIRAEYQEIRPGSKSNVHIYLVHLDDRSVKVTLSYDDAKAADLLPVIRQIKDSVRISK